MIRLQAFKMLRSKGVVAAEALELLPEVEEEQRARVHLIFKKTNLLYHIYIFIIYKYRNNNYNFYLFVIPFILANRI